MSPLISGIVYMGETINGSWCTMVINARAHEEKLEFELPAFTDSLSKFDVQVVVHRDKFL